MKFHILSWLQVAACAAGILLAFPWGAHAERDSFFTGTGKDGAVTISTSNTVVNAYAQVTAALSAGGSSVTVSATTGFAVGDLILVHQTTGISPEPLSGTAGPVVLSSTSVGRWELARILSISGLTLTLTKPLVNSFDGSVTQVIRVPEYSSLTINASRSVIAQAWNGTTGGVVAFLVSGTLTNGGTISTVARGFRGGKPVNDTSGSTGSRGLDEPAPTGAQKGEGLAVSRFGATATGLGRVANAAGGGVAHLSGGGGGGHIGAGGQGGNSEDGGRAVGGQGGAALSYTALNHLLMGGGGGAGHTVNGGTPQGGAGGGCIFVRAGILAGTGTCLASGSVAGNSTSGDAGPGGGAGGTLYLRVAGSAASGQLLALGAQGGSCTTVSSVGPGGGGGGGLIIFQTGSGIAAPSASAVAGGAAGLDQSFQNFGATAGTVGSVTTLSGGFAQVAVPVLATPAAGAMLPPSPVFSGTATASHLVHILVDGVEIGSTTADGSGNFTFTPGTPLATGPHSVAVYAENAPQATFSTDSTAASVTVSALSSNALLSALSLSSGTLSPVFASATTAYSARVLRPSDSITVTPTVADSTATVQVRVNGGAYAAVTSGSASAALALNLGSNTIDVLVTAQDGTTTMTYTTTVTRWTYVEGWRNFYFSTIANTGSAADTAAPQGDGLQNLLKFALGMNPAVTGVSPLAVVRSASTLDVTYPRSIEAMTECTFIIEWSDTLLSGSWSTSGVTESILSATSTLQQVKASIPAASGVQRRFVRLRVTRP